MAVVRRRVAAPVSRVWEVVTDFAGYGRWIPLTRMRVDDPPTRVGWSFAGFTGLGPVGFLDSMLVVEWEPPVDDESRGVFAVRKTGRLLAGWARVELTPVGAHACDLLWNEEITPRPESVGHLLDRVSDPVTSRLFGRAVDQMAAAAESST